MARHIFTSEDTKKSHEVRVYHPLSEEAKRNISQSHIGVKLSPEQRQKQSEARLRYFKEHPDSKFQCTQHFKGKKRSLEARKKGGEGRRKYLQEHPDILEALRTVAVGRQLSVETKEKIGLTHLGLKATVEAREKMRKSRLGMKVPSSSLKHKQQWQNPEFVHKMMKAWNTKPNKKEMELSDILCNLCPGQFEYNGDFSLGITLSGCIPDFVNVNGKKQVIELFGEYWHRTPERGEKEKLRRYHAVGWDCLIIWCNELKDTETLEDKIRVFVGGDSNC